MAGDAVEVKIDRKGLDLALSKIPNTMRAVLDNRLKNHALFFQKVMEGVFTAKRVGPFQRNTTKTKLIYRSGALISSYDSNVYKTFSLKSQDMNLRITMGDGRTGHYVKTQEFGATITPKRSKYLTIPMPANLTGSGRPRFNRARNVPNSILVKKNGTLYIARKLDDDQLEFLFVLKKKVVVPPRLGFVRRWNSKKVRKNASMEINSGIDAALRKAKLR